MSDRQHAIEVGEMFDRMAGRIAELEAKLVGIERDLHETRGREQALLHMNQKQHNTLVNLQTALGLKSGVDHAIKQAKVPALPQLDAMTEQMAQRLAPIINGGPRVVRDLRADKTQRVA